MGGDEAWGTWKGMERRPGKEGGKSGAGMRLGESKLSRVRVGRSTVRGRG